MTTAASVGCEACAASSLVTRPRHFSRSSGRGSGDRHTAADFAHRHANTNGSLAAPCGRLRPGPAWRRS